jgi:ABC-type Na+ efflux pump permease subunit
MPVNFKYLTTSKWQRFAKITAAIIGGYIVTISVHMAIATWINIKNTVMTMAFSGIILWASLMIIAFIPKNGWKTWGTYLLVIALFSIITYLGK